MKHRLQLPSNVDHERQCNGSSNCVSTIYMGILNHVPSSWLQAQSVYTQPSICQISPTAGIWRMNEPADGGSICEVSGRCRAGEVSQH